MQQVTTDTFEAEVLQSATPVLVKFSAPWCGPCKVLQPRLDELATETTGVKFVTVDIDQDGDLAQKYTVMSVPTMLFVKDGKIMDQMVGAQPKEAIASKLNELS